MVGYGVTFIAITVSAILYFADDTSCYLVRPGPVTMARIIPLGSSAFYIQWKPPIEITETEITNYEITYSSPVRGGQVLSKPSARKVFVSGFKENEEVKFSICALSWNRSGPKIVIESKTGEKSTSNPAKPGFVLTIKKENSTNNVLVEWLPCGVRMDCGNARPGSEFIVKYKIKGSPFYEAILGSDGYALVPITLNKAYEFIVISVDGYFRTESDPLEVFISS